MDENTPLPAWSTIRTWAVRPLPRHGALPAFIPGEVQASFGCFERAPSTAAFHVLLPDLKHPLMLVDAAAGIHEANQAAHRLLRESDVMRASSGGVLDCSSPEDRRTLREAVHDVHGMHRAGSAQRQPVRGVRLYRRDGSQLHVFLWLAKPLPPHPRCAVVLVHDSRRAEDDSDSALVANALSLTPAEARVALKLADGWLVKDIARAHDTSVATVRSQVQHALHKVGVSRQVDLVRLLLALPFCH